MKKVIIFLKSLLITPELPRFVPTFYRSDSISDQLRTKPTVGEMKKMHDEELAVLVAQIDEQRVANHHTINIMHKTLVIALLGFFVSTLSVIVAILAVVAS